MSSQTNTTGSDQATASVIASWKAPAWTAPSPKNGIATVPVRRTRAASPAPTASGIPPPTIPFAPRMPSAGSAMCIDPPLPRQMPVSRPKSSAIIASGSAPLAMQWPWPRCVVVMTSPAPSAPQAPAATASWPIDTWTKPWTSPARKWRATASSKRRMRSIVR